MTSFRRLRSSALVGCLLVLALGSLAVLLTPLPAELRPEEQPAVGTRFLDRHGRLIRTARLEGGARAEWVRVDELSPTTIAAVLAAEDKRFFQHPGIDPIATVRALGQLVWHRRTVSGGSTLTQQLARTLQPRPRTLGGKLREARLALRLELSLGKRQILEQYVNRVDFGPNVRGIAAASRFYFDKPASALSLAEAATLAGMIRGPTLYDPSRRHELALRRRDRVLGRLADAHGAASDAISAALATPLVLQPRPVESGAHHFLVQLARELPGDVDEVTTTLDLGLQREVERLTRDAVDGLTDHDVTAASVLVLDNASGDVLAYVGSPRTFDDEALGHNDGVNALRQPGSALKPFVYAAAIEELGFTAASVLPDIELHLATAQGDYTPRNYDRRFHGPVRLREALSASLNVPAVAVAAKAGPPRVLRTLHRVGFQSLDRDANYYGAAIALGDGEVRLHELARAYSALAQRGRLRPLRQWSRFRHALGDEEARAPGAAEQVLRPETAALLFDMLSDPVARASAFGRGNVLEFPFPVAAKTGTSKGHRDNLTVGSSGAVTVAVWVGNFDGRPMLHTSGITGAGPLFREVMLAAMRGRDPSVESTSVPLVAVDVCEQSGLVPGPHCPHVVREKFAKAQLPLARCDLHQEVWVDERDGLLSAAGCPGAERRVVEAHAARYRAWALRAGRPLAPSAVSPRCPQARLPEVRARITFPFDGARFVRDPSLAVGQQRLFVRVSGNEGTYRLFFDGRPLGRGEPNVPLTPGAHRLLLSAAGHQETVTFDVE
ncbi:MAG: penicillin-binding protein 1C [Polyangiaceae bacterium]